jgi:predicted CopG family antitoxin
MKTKNLRIDEELHAKLYRFKEPSESFGSAVQRLYEDHPDTDE